MASSKTWIARGRHLPRFMRDFHAQKDVFKLIARMCPQDEKDPYKVSWIAGHCFVVDRFLRVMALCGWTLQRTRAAENFSDIEAEIARMKDEDAQAFAKMLDDNRAERATKGGA